MPPAIQSRMQVSAVAARVLDLFAALGGREQPRLAGHQRGRAGGGKLLEEVAAGLVGGQVVEWHVGSRCGKGPL